MDYLQRLLARSLAVPRDQGSSVFDPFAQVAAWEFDASAPAVTSSAGQASAIAPVAAVESTPIAPPVQPLPAAATEPAAISPPRALADPHVDDAAATAPGGVTPAAIAAGPQPLTPEPAPLARADAFMRALGMKSIVAPEPPASSPTARSPTAASTAPDSTPRPSERSEAATMPVLVRPALPPAIEIAKPKENSRARGEAPRDARAHAAAPAPRQLPPLAAPVERIVQTTVVVAPASRGLDDLAHSSGISRFGIGQG